MGHGGNRRQFAAPRALCAAAFLATYSLLPFSATATQYDVVTLDQTSGVPTGIYEGTVVGYDHTGLPTVWTNNGTTVTHLAYPPGYGGVGGATFAVFGNQVGGGAYDSNTNAGQALLWNGFNSQPINLGAFAAVTSIYNGVQAGYISGPQASVWRGSAATLVDLNPTTTLYTGANSIWGNQVAGTWFHDPTGSDPHAALWTSLSPSGFVDLTLPGVYSGSNALAIARGQEAGYVGVAGTNHAAIWSGTAASFQDLGPGGTTASELQGTNGVQQVGDVSFMPGSGGLLPPDHHAAIWNGTADSFQLLPGPPGTNTRALGGTAYAIDGDGDVVGVIGGHVVMWIPNRLSGDTNFDGTVGFSDLLLLSQHYGQSGEWVDGDFNGDGLVNFSDLLILAQNYGKSESTDQMYSAVSLGGDSVPEPSCILLAACGLLCRRPHRPRGTD